MNMTKEELFKMELGSYQITDGIYSYQMEIGLSYDKKKTYRIVQKGSLTAHLFLIESKERNDDGKWFKCMYAIASIGGISLHSIDTYDLLSKLQLVNE